jgi:hypothetical protein
MRKLRKLRFVPLAFVVGAEGFVLFAPYLIVFMAVVLLVRSWQGRGALAAVAG